ncbi:putative inosine/uridine-preferring nucleoside hydrolase domain, ribonucleoside hydrolase [Helianthus annuus]|nr:putative inosine/uridine-preferring nucleoside hydrolase domain, ribonucleoside hydrolase [Helianthus annuus]KAJ0769070.1 putative inosine/uridine-preferring nucleoside hydrolase domain, ribonucleoside hydrolase [Helianthus annuus]KAJ0936896.1 putative inosine/uridine-preferring nucleoside hydrolase domain, ribonucleoside hydrolase [Helianthus annuus]
MKGLWLWSSLLFALTMVVGGTSRYNVRGGPSYRLILDTDVDTDDLFALLYLLKSNRSEFNLQAVTINTNSWTNAGHAVNQIYDILYMMGRDDIDVGVGGDGGILENGTIQPNVGGYLPIIDQGRGTAGPCRYRQAIPVAGGGRLDIDTNMGIRRSFLPQGNRRYSPLRQPTAQQVLIKTISEGPVTVFITGVHTNMAIFLMTNPNLKKNIDHIYIMGGGVRSKNPTGCCPKNASSTCQPQQCGDHGNMFTAFRSNPYAEFNLFGDPFAAYQVFHSGIPITLVPLDATNTIPITHEFFEAFEKNQRTYEAQYVFKSLKIARDTWFDDQFYTSYFMWDSFMAGVAASAMRNIRDEENEFAEMEYMNITVITSNEPYGIPDSSNAFFGDRKIPKFNLKKNGVHSGHVQIGIQDPFCFRGNATGICKDGYTEEVTGPDSVRVRVATRAKPNVDESSTLDREYYVNYLDVLNQPQHKGRFNFTTEFPYYKEVLYKPDFKGKKLGKIVVFDMDMSAGDFLALFYLLKVPVEEMNLKAILVTGSGWANAATIDVVYDLLHMMGRDDITVGLGDSFGVNQSYSKVGPTVGDCKYSKAIPHGSGGRLDSDTLYGLARDLPRSPRGYTAQNSVKFGAPRDTDFPRLRQPLALEVWRSLVKSIDDGSKITILTNGPLTNLANILLSESNASSIIQEVFILGGHINYKKNQEKGNVIHVPSNKYAELNMFLDTLAAKTVFESSLDITLIPLHAQRKVYALPKIIKMLQAKNMTHEAVFTRRLLTRLHHLHQRHHLYRHVDMFAGEILGAIILAGDQKLLNSTFEIKHLKVYTEGQLSRDGEVIFDTKKMKGFKVLQGFNHVSCYNIFSNALLRRKQSAVIGSFGEQKRRWSSPTA